MRIFTDEADPFFPLSDHIADKAVDLRVIVHVQPVRLEGPAETVGGGIDEQQRDVQVTEHSTVGVVKDLDAGDAGGFVRIKGVRKQQPRYFFGDHPVYGETVA